VGALFLFMVLLTTPITASAQDNPLGQQISTLLRRMHLGRIRLDAWVPQPLQVRLLQRLREEVPAYLLVVVNTIVLPDMISRIALRIRTYRRSTEEVIQMHLNYVFLLINTMVIPFLGLTTIGYAFSTATHELATDASVTDLLPRLVDRLLHCRGIFALRYLIGAACITNFCSLMQPSQRLFRWLAKWRSITLRQRVEAELPFVFAWGYYYAWAMCAFTIGICMSSVIPGTLPCAALFFGLQYWVDKYNLTARIYQHGGFEAENLFAVRGIHYMRCIVATWWMMMGLTFTSSAKQQSLSGQWNATIPAIYVQYIGGSLVVASIGLVFYSWYTQQALLHDSHFQTVDLSQSQSLLGGTMFFQWAFRTIDRIKKWLQGYTEIVPFLRMDSGSVVDPEEVEASVTFPLSARSRAAEEPAGQSPTHRTLLAANYGPRMPDGKLRALRVRAAGRQGGRSSVKHAEPSTWRDEVEDASDCYINFNNLFEQYQTVLPV